MDFTQMITLLDSISGFSAFFSGIGDALTGSGNMMTGSGDMAEGTAKLVEALGTNGTLNEIAGGFLSGSLEGTGSTGSLGSASTVGSALLGSTSGS